MSKTNNTSFFYLRRLVATTKCMSKHRIGAIALAPTQDGKLIASFFMEKPTQKIRPGYMKAAAVGRLNSTDKYIEVPISRNTDGSINHSKTLQKIVDDTKLVNFYERNYGTLDTVQFDVWLNGLVGAMKTLTKPEAATA